jgi:hypothetical protein
MGDKGKGGNGDQDKGKAEEHYRDLKNAERWTRIVKETVEGEQQGGGEGQ